MVNNVPMQGGIIKINLDLKQGHEQKGYRYFSEYQLTQSNYCFPRKSIFNFYHEWRLRRIEKKNIYHEPHEQKRRILTTNGAKAPRCAWHLALLGVITN
jgi:hypothetical protein